MNQQLQDYINKAKAAGLSNEQIRQSLINKGWQETDIERGFEALNINELQNMKDESIEQMPKKKSSKNRFIKPVIIVVSIIAILALITGLYLYILKPYIGNKPTSQEQSQETALGTALEKLTLISKENKTVSSENIIFNDDITKVAYKVERDGKSFVIVNEEESVGYDDLYILGFMPESQEIIYLANEANKWFYVVGDKKGKAYDLIEPSTGPRDKLTYKAKKGNKWIIVMDDEESRQYDEIGKIYTSQDGSRYFYAATLDNRVFYIIDGQEVEDKYDLSSLTSGYNISLVSKHAVFSPDNQKYYYFARDRDEVFLIVNGEETKRYRYITHPRFSLDSQKLVYIAANIGGDKQFLVINEEEQKEYDRIQEFIISADSQRIAYSASEPTESSALGKYFIVIDGQEVKKYNSASSPKFSPDSTKIAYIAKENNQKFIVVNDKEGQRYDEIISFIFSPDSSKLVYIAEKANQYFVIEDEVESKGYDLAHFLRFSPNSQRFAYIIVSEGKQAVVVDGEKQPFYDSIVGPYFSGNSKTVVYSARSGDKWRLVVNGKEGKKYDNIWPYKKFPKSTLKEEDFAYYLYLDELRAFFTSDYSKIIYGARSDNEIWRIVEDIQ